MKLRIDGMETIAGVGMTLHDLVCRLGLDQPELSRRPLAAKIAGEVFTLNYIPVRQQDEQTDRPSIRRAMAASNGVIRLLRYTDEAGKEAYMRTAQFMIFLAMRQLWPKAVVKMNCTVGSSVYMQVSGVKDFSVDMLKERVGNLVAQNIPLIRRRVPLDEAIDHYANDGQMDKAGLLSWRTVD